MSLFNCPNCFFEENNFQGEKCWNCGETVYELDCPNCEHKFFEIEYNSGYCPNCEEVSYYWDDGWNYKEEETTYDAGFKWDV